MIASTTLAQDIGINDVIYQEPSQQESIQSPTITLVNNISFELIKKHLTIAGIVENITPSDEALTVIKGLEDLLKTEIIQALSFSEDKQNTLTTYLTQCNEYLEKWANIIMSLQQELALTKLDMNACQVDKNIADKSYFQWVNNYDDLTAQEALTQSIQSDKCATENRIQYNAKTYLLQKAVFFESLLQERYDLLYNEQNLLVNHFDVISDTLIAKLNLINETLQKYPPEYSNSIVY